MADSFNAKRISDPVHGTIGLSEAELQVVSTKAFQRLRNVKHLGLVDYVFPGATYARFSHCLGVCHLTGRILQSLKDNYPRKVKDKDIERCRMAALLHDIGHYPFSHVMEEPVEDYYKEPLIQSKAGSRRGKSTTIDPQLDGVPGFFTHVMLGEEIVTNDPELTQVVSDCGFKPDDIVSLLSREKPSWLNYVISSDLDADRIDYLLRTAHHTGLPYGSVDLDYILSQMRLDGENQLCLTRKALRAADHFLLCRYFDYTQVCYHKTVAAFELVLKDVMRELMKSDLLKCSGPEIRAKIDNGTWSEFDDAYVVQNIRGLLKSDSCDEVCRLQSRAILERRAPKMLYEDIWLAEARDNRHKKRFEDRVRFVRDRKPDWASQFDIDPRLWYLWPKSLTPTKVGPHVDASDIAAATSKEQDDLRQSVRILDEGTNKSQPITEVDDALMRLLGDCPLFAIRLYVLLPPEKQHLEKDIREHVEKEWPP